jgi:hypothetical protein
VTANASRDRSWLTEIALSSVIGGLFLCLSLIPRGPTPQTADDNWWATHHKGCTEYYWGWPLAVYSQYPQGFVHPDEPLAWDCGPRYERWQPLNIAGNAALLFLAWAAIFIVGTQLRTTKRIAK